MEEYTYWLRENLAGSAVLTKAMEQALPRGNVAPSEDLLYDPRKHDLLEKAVHTETKLRAKS